MEFGRELKTIQNVECYSKGGQTWRQLGYVVLYEEGLVFYKVKGAVLAQAGFGLLGAAVSGGSRKGEFKLELPYSDIVSVRVCNKMLNAAIEIIRKDGNPVYLLSQSRLFNGKSALSEYVDIINRRLKNTQR